MDDDLGLLHSESGNYYSISTESANIKQLSSRDLGDKKAVNRQVSWGAAGQRPVDEFKLGRIVSWEDYNAYFYTTSSLVADYTPTF
jgi:hypothetical protein